MNDEKLNKLLDYIKPTSAFANTLNPEKPDYSNLDNWAAYPKKDSQQFLVPNSSFTINKSNNDVDVFYIHPTGFYEKTWNSNMEKNRSAYERTEIMLGNQATVFGLAVIIQRVTSLTGWRCKPPGYLQRRAWLLSVRQRPRRRRWGVRRLRLLRRPSAGSTCCRHLGGILCTPTRARATHAPTLWHVAPHLHLLVMAGRPAAGLRPPLADGSCSYRWRPHSSQRIIWSMCSTRRMQALGHQWT